MLVLSQASSQWQMAYCKYRPDRGYLKTGSTVPQSTSNDTAGPLHRVVVYRFTVSDCDDPIVYAAEPMFKWENSECGKWVKEHGADLEWRSQLNVSTYGTDFVILATLREVDYTFFLLKFT